MDSTMNTLSKVDETMIATALRDGIEDRGSHCLTRDEQAIIFHQVSDSLVFQAGHSPENYPAWSCRVSPMSEDDLRGHIRKLVDDGWTIQKTQFDDLVSVE